MQLTIETSSTLRGQYYSVLHCTTPYYTRYNTVLSVLQSTTQHYSVLHSTTLYYIKTTQYDTPYYKVPWRREKFAFRHSFGRATITFCKKRCFGNAKCLHFILAFSLRRARSDERVVSRRGPPKLPSAKKRGAAFSKSSLSQQPLSAAILTVVRGWRSFFGTRSLKEPFRDAFGNKCKHV